MLHTTNRLLLLTLAFLLASCAGSPGPRSSIPSDANRSTYLAALEPLPGDPSEARKRLSAFVRSEPQSVLADDAAYKLAELAVLQNDPEDARRWLDWLVQNHPRGNRVTDARLRLAGLEYEDGNLSAARRLLLPLKFSRLKPDQKKKAYRLLANLATTRSAELRWLEQLEQVEEETSDTQGLGVTNARIDGLLASADTQSLDAVAAQLGDTRLGTRIQLARAERALALGQADVANDAIERARRRARSDADEERIVRVQERLAMRAGGGSLDEDGLPPIAEAAARSGFTLDGASGTLGVVLPLSGPFASYGEESLKGILLAAGIFGADPSTSGDAAPKAPGSRSPDAATGRAISLGADGVGAAVTGLQVRVRDTAGDPVRAEQAVRELAADPSVVAIIGPLLSRPGDAAAGAAQEQGVPLLVMTRRDEIAENRPDVMRLRMSPRDEVGFLVKYAVEDLGARRFAILYPRDNYGLGMRQEFWEAVDREGGFVVGASSYDPNATDFAEPIRNMIGYRLLTPLEEQALEERDSMIKRARRLPPEDAALTRQVAYEILGPEKVPLPPQVDFDALFIPDSHEKVVLIAPQLAFHEVDDVQLLGASGWNDPELVEIAREHVKGAVISTAFDEASRFPFVADFVTRYRDAYGTDPGVLAAESFDATNLVRVQLAAGLSTRSEVRQGILAVRGYPGVSGVTAFDASGFARKRPFLLGVERKKIVSLD